MYRSTFAGFLRAAAFVVALLGLTGAALAQSAQPTAAQIKLAREVVESSGDTRAFDTIVLAILQQSMNMFLQQNPDLQKDLVASLQTIRPEFDKRRDEILDIASRVYASRFSEAEMKEILAFQRSTTGKKYVTSLPAIVRESNERTREWGAKLSEQVVERLRVEMKKKGHTI